MRQQPFRFLPPVVAGLAVVLSFPLAANAHPTFGSSGTTAGLLHPFSGVDHLLAMIAVGVWAAQLAGRRVWLLPATFIAGMSAGGIAAALGLGLPGIEGMILASTLVFGACVALASRPKTSAAIVMTAIFSTCHGHAHLAEMPQGAVPMAYFAGMLLGTAGLLAAGVGIAFAARRVSDDRLVRLSGAGVTAAGALLALGLI